MSRPRKGPRLIERKGSFILVYRDASGAKRERRLAATNETDAKREEAAFILSGQGQPRISKRADPECYPIVTALAQYAAEHGIHTTDPTRIANAIDRLEPFWCELMVGDIFPQICKDYLAFRLNQTDTRFTKNKARTVTQSTVRREMVVLRAAVNHAYKEGRIKYAPFVWLPEEGAHRERWLTRSEVAQLVWAARTSQAKDYLPRFILLALYTAARKTALLELTWDRVDLETGVIEFNLPGRKQTNKRRARVIVSNNMLMLLRFWYRRKQGEFVIHENGRQLGDILNGFTAAAARAGFGPDVIPHTMRHTAATWMKEAMVSKDLIGQFLGHKDSNTTERYAHKLPNHLAPAATALRNTGKRHSGSFAGSFAGGSAKGKNLSD